jgi:Transposase zinc-ribbon domain
MFPNEAACLRYLEQLRWPGSFACEKCGAVGESFRLATRLWVLKCRSCHHETSVTAGSAYVERPHYLHLHMGHLRWKLEREPARLRLLRTETGIGYRLAGE